MGNELRDFPEQVFFLKLLLLWYCDDARKFLLFSIFKSSARLMGLNNFDTPLDKLHLLLINNAIEKPYSLHLTLVAFD